MIYTYGDIVSDGRNRICTGVCTYGNYVVHIDMISFGGCSAWGIVASVYTLETESRYKVLGCSAWGIATLVYEYQRTK